MKNNKDDVQNLIELIKKEALEKAQKEANKIISDAKVSAGSIIEDATSEANDMKSKAKNEVDTMIKNGTTELNGIARDVIGGLQVRIMDLFENSFTSTANIILSKDEYLAEFCLIAKKQFSGQAVEILAPEGVISCLQKEVSSKDVILTINEKSVASFIIKAGGKEFSFGEHDVKSVVLEYCSPKLKELLTKKGGN